MAAPDYDMQEEVCVMLVDHDKEFVNEMVDLLMSCGYKVMTVDMTSAAMSMLSKGKTKIDVMIINVNSLDLQSFQRLADQAVALNIVSLCVYDEHNPLLEKKAFDTGAYLYLKKPLHEEIAKYLWQFVLREKIQKKKRRERLEENGDHVNVIGGADDIGDNNIAGDEEQVVEKNVSGNNVISNGKYKLTRKRGRNSTEDTNKGESQSSANKTVGKKVCTEWTIDLHTKFVEAMQQLGDGRCYPLDILKVMNVPGLTRMQVASHLQKCRNNNWRAQEKRKSICHPPGQRSSSGSQQRSSFKKFGRMPHFQTNIPSPQQQQRNPNQTQSSPHNINNIFTRGESSSQQQLNRPQLQVQPRNPSIVYPFNNPSLSTQNSVGGGLQQHGPLFGTLGSQGLQGPTITNYRSGPPFNSGDHHTQNDYELDLNVPYELDLNVPYVTTNSDSAIMSNVDIENATSNEFGAANPSFHLYIGESNMYDPSNIVAASHASDTDQGSYSNERENYEAYMDSKNMDYIFQNLESPGADLPNEQGSEFDQVYSDDQVMTPSVQFPGIANSPDESA
ncbi:two-component response regulator ORR21-like [Lycium barbarum]|uniref:two-component response regulator ORR21-like n=1 Tax=Lycium barbarum TaxID=112863 RepID=UPI00293ECFF1|nr:two-component response regulator ORR21-like [Lycium barbarum]